MNQKKPHLHFDTVHVILTPGQIQLLEPLFRKVRASDGRCALMAQVFRDGMAVKFIPADVAHAIQDVTGADDTTIYHSRDQVPQQGFNGRDEG